MKKQQVLAFVAKAEGTTLSLDVYEAIGESFWGDSVSAKDVLKTLRESKPSVVNMRVNSGGGDLFDAVAISTLLQATGAKINVSIDGIAASAATHLWPVGSSVTIAKNAMMMIHKAWNIVLGNSDEMAKMGELLAKADAIQAANYEQYAKSRGLPFSSADFAQLMSAETWLSAEECLAYGLVDSIGESVSIAASIDVSAFRNPPTAFVARVAAAKSFTAPTAALLESEHMDPKTMQAAIEAKDAELATIKAERDALQAKAQKFEVEAAALTTQNATLAAERDAIQARLDVIEAKALDAEVDALIPNVLDPAERDNFVALAKTSRSLFDSMVAQRKPRQLTTQVIESSVDDIAAANAGVGADEKFDSLVSKDLT